jgi:tetratricopeptide (TPR) repeat protein
MSILAQGPSYFCTGREIFSGIMKNLTEHHAKCTLFPCTIEVMDALNSSKEESMRTPKKISVFLPFAMILLPFVLLFSQSEEATQIYENNKEGVVYFVAYGEEKNEIAKGTGFIIDQKVLATCYHLVSQARSAEGNDYKGKKVKFDGIIAVDKERDIALVKINRKKPALPLGNSDEVSKTAKIVSLGGNEIGEITLAEGEVLGFHQVQPNQKMIETTLAVPDSYSGAPVFDSSGSIIGMVVFLDFGKKITVPINYVKNMPKSGSETKFKDWNQEDYFSTLPGAYLAARTFYSLNETGKAEKFLRKVVELKPDDMESQTILASVLVKQRNYTSAVSTYNKIIQLNPNLDIAHYGLGLVYVKMMKWEEAIPPLKKAIQLNSENTEAYSQIGKAYQELRKFNEAAEAYKKYLDTNPQQSGEVYKQLGVCQMELEQYQDAVVSFQEASKQFTQDINLIYKLAQAHEKAGDIEKAAETYFRLAELSPEDTKVYYNTIINMYNNAKMPEKAAETAQKLIELNPNDTDAMYNLGYMYVQMEEYTKAIEAFQKVLEVNPAMEFAHLQVGYCYTQLKKYDEAVAAYKKMVEIFPENSNAWLGMAIGYMQQKKFANAVDPLKKVIELEPNNGNAYYNLAICYLNLHDNYSARQIYENLKSIDPGLAQKLKQYIK